MTMTKKTNKNRNLFFLAASLILAACSSGPPIQEYSDTASPTDELSKYEYDMNRASDNQVDVLSPGNFDKAQSALSEARRSADKQNSARDTLHEIAKGRAYLDLANITAQTSRRTIGDVASARQQAIAAGATRYLPDEFQKIDGKLKDATRSIEKNDLKDAKEARTQLQEKYMDIELQAIKINKLGGARKTMAQAINEGARDFAPRSLSLTEKSILDTEAYITANRHNTQQIDIKSDLTAKTAIHLLKITRDSKSGKRFSSEDQALRLETEQVKVAEKQTQIDDKDAQLFNKQNQLDSGQSQNSRLTAENSDLSLAQDFNQRFEEARSEFNANEAEVYKQGDVLTIRLRELEFSTGKASLKESNFPLLAKVQKVISHFGKSKVTIEGHTDSMGSKIANQKLSTARADAVKAYLTANPGGQPYEIQTIGYGYQKPLATNKTAAGRAQNRRVDILIQPSRE